MSDDDDSDEAEKESVRFAWTSQKCQVRIVVFLFVLSILLGALTAYIIIPRLKEDCKKYHLRKQLSKNKRGLAIPVRNRTSRGGSDKSPATSNGATTVSSRLYNLRRNNASFSSDTRGLSSATPPDRRTRSSLDDAAGDLSVLPIDFRPDNGSDSEDVVVIMGSDRTPVMATTTAEVTAEDDLSFITWTTLGKLSKSASLENVDQNAVQTTATGALRDDTEKFRLEENTTMSRYAERSSETAWAETFVAALSTSTTAATSSDVSPLDKDYRGGFVEAEITSEYYPLSEARATDNATNVSVATGLDAPEDENRQTSDADVISSFSGSGASTWPSEVIETIILSSTAQVMLSSEQSKHDTNASVTSSAGTATLDERHEPSQASLAGGFGDTTSDTSGIAWFNTTLSEATELNSMIDYSPSRDSYSISFEERNTGTLVATSDITEDMSRNSSLIAIGGNLDGTTTDYQATIRRRTSISTASDPSDNNAVHFQQELYSTVTGQETPLHNDTGGLGHLLITQERKLFFSESEATPSESGGTVANTGPDVSLTSVVSVAQQENVTPATHLLNFTKFDVDASSKGNLENASEFGTHYVNTIMEPSSRPSYFVPRHISEVTSTERSTFANADDATTGRRDMAQHTSLDSEYDDSTQFASVSSLITKLISDKLPFETATDDDALKETVSGAEFDITVRQAKYESEATEAEDYDDTVIPEVSPTFQRLSTPDTTTTAHSTETDADENVEANDNSGIWKAKEALQQSRPLPNIERLRNLQGNMFRNINRPATSQGTMRLAHRSNRRRGFTARRHAKHFERTFAPQAKIRSLEE
ncbi:serine-rich adhesin for platelets-like [Dermacentor albipictus]|uniref:serine-rich adhesin for platelets-like n=1 Tax=Dermacentor albipictus TaxID=60249 RepID=UPI0038FD1A8A